MKQFTPEEVKIHNQISEKLDIPLKDVEQSLDLFWKGVAAKIKLDEPCEILIPYLGKYIPSDAYLKKHEVNNT